MADNSNVLARFENMYKYFGITHAVDGVTLEVTRGEIHGLVGENGSGKSTLLSLIAGIRRPDSGKMTVNGQDYAPHDNTQASQRGVSMIVQEINTLAGLTVAENIFLGQEHLFTKYGFRNIKKMNEMAREYLNKAGLDLIKPDEEISHYSLEQRKLIEMVKASYIKPELLMIDETSTALSHDGRDEMYKLMKDTRARNGSVLLISHDLQEIFQFCDRITIMRDGRVVDTVNAKDVDEDKLKALMVGRDVSGHYYREDYGTPISDKVVLRTKGLTCPGHFENIDLELHEGEILGLGGLSESGMHEIGRAIFGIEYDVTGDVIIGDKKVEGIQQTMHAGLGYVSKNRDVESLFAKASIADNINVTCMDKLSRGIYLSPRKMKKFADESTHTLSVKMRDVDQLVGELSGGNKQKVALTKWMARGTKIFVMDSPTRGIDVAVKAVIYDLLTKLKDQGCSMIVISEELLELIGVCDRILVTKDGRIVDEFLRSPDLSEETIVKSMI